MKECCNAYNEQNRWENRRCVNPNANQCGWKWNDAQWMFYEQRKYGMSVKGTKNGWQNASAARFYEMWNGKEAK